MRNLSVYRVVDNLNELSDVVLSSVALGDILAYNGTNWVNTTSIYDVIGVNADTLNGYGSTAFASSIHVHNTSDITNIGAISVDLLDGKHYSDLQQEFSNIIHYHSGAAVTSIVNSSTWADTVDGYHAAALASSVHVHVTSDITNIGLINVDMVDGYHFNQNVNTTSIPTFSGLIINNTISVGELIQTRSGSITRDGGYISSIAKTGGRTLTIARDNLTHCISSIVDNGSPVRTWAFTRDVNNYITSWTVT